MLPALAVGLAIGHILGLQAHRRIQTRALDRALVAILTTAAGASIRAATTWLRPAATSDLLNRADSTYKLEVCVRSMTIEDDSDIHLVIADPTTPSTR